ncbi:MAG: diguanylate cyclase domain-containing protein [Chromatiales bacterium]
MLVELSHWMRASLRPGDTLARLGGDEFVVLLENIADESDATHVAARIIEHIHGLKQVGDFSSGYQQALASPSVAPRSARGACCARRTWQCTRRSTGKGPYYIYRTNPDQSGPL